MIEELLLKIDSMIDASARQLAEDTVRLVKIKSVESESQTGAPFGKGAKEALDVFMTMADSVGLHVTDYNVGVISASMRAGTADLGIWLHADVVPEGDGWSFSPYDATEYKGCIVGRGATDNKGQLAAVLNLFRVFKELNIELKYNPAIYLGSNEETGMKDLVGIDGNPDARGFINTHTPPRMSLVPDGGFPVGYGGKGAVDVTLRSKTPLYSCSLIAGQNSSPGLATAVLNAQNVPDSLPGCTVTKGNKTEITAFSPPRHGARPDPNGNMITSITTALLAAGLVTEEEKHILEFLRNVSLDVYGNMLGIETSHEIMGNLTVFSKKIDFVDTRPEITLNIRYPLGITSDQIEEQITDYAEKNGFSVIKFTRGVSPYMNNPDTQAVKMLCKVANEIIGDDAKPYTLSGATYAHRLPNAYVYGMNGCLPPDDFPAGRGGAHGIDECVSLDRLKRAMKIYARALLALNDMEW